MDLRIWAKATSNRPGLIRVVLLDVDGCLTAGEAAPLDLPVLQLVAGLNRRAREEPDLPGVTLCTGRPEPYVELLCQAIDCFLPAIWETGAGLYLPGEFRFLTHRSLTAERLEMLDEARRIVHSQVVRTGLGYRQIGKEFSITLYPHEGVTLDRLYDELVEPLMPYGDHYTLYRQRTCVELLPNGIDKGVGAHWLAELLGLPLARMAGVGDQLADLSYLSIVGVAAAPSDATQEVRAMAKYVAPRPSSQGLVDILNWLVVRNASLTSAAPRDQPAT